MNHNPDIIDKAIEALKKERAVPPLSENTIDTTKALLAEEQEKNKKKPREKANIIKNLTSAENLAKTAIAAAVLMAAILGITLFLTINKKPQTQTAQKINVAEPRQPELLETEIKTTQDSEQTLQAELQNIREMVAEGDTNGLLDILRNGQKETKVAVAYYLGRIGDLSTVYALKQASKNLAPKEPNNPFERAARTIIKRSGLEEFITNLTPEEKARLRQKLFAPKGILSGLVLDAQTGEPIEDAEVTITKSRSHTTRTDANGFYHFDEIEEPGNYKIGIWSDLYQGIHKPDEEPVVGLSNKTRIVKHFHLKPACMLQLQVLNEQREPLEGVRLIPASLADEREIGPSMSSRKTDANGLILLGGFKPSDSPYSITAIPPSKQSGDKDTNPLQEQKEYAPAHLTVTLTDPDVIEYREMILKKGLAVRGYAEYPDGIPAEGLAIIAKPDWWHCATPVPMAYIDPNGYFILHHIVPGNYSISVFTPTEDGEHFSGSSRPLSQIKLPPEDGGLMKVTVPEKSPDSLVSISGKLTFNSKKKPGYISINAFSKEHGHRIIHKGIENETETFTIDRLEPGTYRLTFSGRNVERKVIENVKAPNDNIQVKLKYVTRPVLECIVLSADDQEPLGLFRARTKKVAGLSGNRYTQSDKWIEFNDPNGKFNIETAGPGIYQVQFDAEGFAPLWSRKINTETTDLNEPITVELTKGGSIEGIVKDPQGIPLTGAKVIPLSLDCGLHYLTEGKFVSEEAAVETVNGRFALEHIPVGTETLKVTHPDYCAVVIEGIEIRQGETTKNIEIQLAKGGAVQGYVYGTDGEPQLKVTLHVQNTSSYISERGQPGLLATVVTNSNGFYHAKGLPEQICYIIRSNPWNHLGVVREAFLPSDGKTTRLNFGDGPTLTGQLIIKDQPLTNRKMQLSDGQDSFKCYARTDSKGKFAFTGIPTGQYALYYENTQKNDWKKAAAVDCGEKDLDLRVVPRLWANLSVTVLNDSNDPNLKASEIYLVEGTQPQNKRIETITDLESKKQPYALTGLIAGTYTVVAARKDGLMFRKEINVTKPQHKITLHIAGGNGSVAGTFYNSTMPAAILWSQDKNIFALLLADKDKTCQITNLAPGDYCVTSSFYQGTPLLQFALAENEAKTLAIDTAALKDSPIATAIVYALDENGILIPGADIWLESDTEHIEPVESVQRNWFIAGPGEYLLHASCPGYLEQAEPIYLEKKSIRNISYEPPVIYVHLSRQP